MTESPGVDTEEAADFLTFEFRPITSTSGLPTAFMTFMLGRVPKGAIFWTAPCLSIPASAKLGRGGGKGGSTHLSIKVFGFSEESAAVFEDSIAAVGGAATNGLEILERVGRGVELLMALPRWAFSLSLRPAVPRVQRTTIDSLAQG